MYVACWVSLPSINMSLVIPFLFWKKCFYIMIFTPESQEVKHIHKLCLINNTRSSPRSSFFLNVSWWARHLQWPGADHLEARGQCVGSGIRRLWQLREESEPSHCESAFTHSASVWFCLGLSCACRPSSLSLRFNRLLQHHYLSPLPGIWSHV